MSRWNKSIISEAEVRGAVSWSYARWGNCDECSADKERLYRPLFPNGPRSALAPYLCSDCRAKYSISKG